MKEVKEKRFAGPYDEILFKYFIQSPVGLVPKSGGKTRLIFHLSFNFSQNEQHQSVNYFIPKDLCSVQYIDLDSAVRACLAIIEEGHRITGSRTIYLGKSDGLSAFRTLPLRRGSWPWLVMLAIDPATGKQQFFVDKCLPFGSSISCSHYQRFSDTVHHLICYWMTIICLINYLDDFLFIQYMLELCNNLMRWFLHLCEDIRMPIAFDKTKWGSTTVIFLGNLLDGQKLYISLPLDKKDKALCLLNDFTGKKKATIKNLQVLAGYLNFLSCVIFAGRAFTRRIYAKYASTKEKKLKQHHHVSLDKEFQFDLNVWRLFLVNHHSRAVCRPMVDLSHSVSATDIEFTSDASTVVDLGFGAIFGKRWNFG